MKWRICFFGLLFLFLSVSAQRPQEIAFVLKLTGEAKIKTAVQDWSPLLKGARIHAGDRILTGENTVVSIIFLDDKTMIKIRSLSEVELKGEKTPGGIAKQLLLDAGEMWSKVTPNGAGYRVVTPSGVAAVKGTEFYVIVDQQEQTFVFGVEGLVQLLNRLGEILIGEGQLGTAKKGEKPVVAVASVLPDWAMADEPQELDVEFTGPDGIQKHLIIHFKKK
jgi:ferric-dicitrate binding protein FerR (iron transport regulator)